MFRRMLTDRRQGHDFAVKLLGDETPKTITRELIEAVRMSASINLTVKESVRARMSLLVKRILKKHGYPPGKRE